MLDFICTATDILHFQEISFLASRQRLDHRRLEDAFFQYAILGWSENITPVVNLVKRLVIHAVYICYDDGCHLKRYATHP